MSKHTYDYGVFIGRFQPLHVGHTHIIDEALKQVGTLIVIVGSADSARTIKNPFTFAERKHMIEAHYRHEVATGRLMVEYAGDVAHSDDEWADGVQHIVDGVIMIRSMSGPHPAPGAANVALAGYGKDASSFYLKMFPGWASIQIEAQRGTLNATDVRGSVFQRLPRIPTEVLTPSTAAWLADFKWTDEFRQLVAEWEYYADYERMWGKGPFLTGDTIVFHQGEILLGTRGKIPGKGMLALPGGFRNPREKLQDACVRELREETGLDLDTVRHRYTTEFDVDTPGRSLRGDVITHVLAVELPHNFDRSTLRAADDLQDLGWFKFDTLSPDQFFDDHWSIIRNFIENHH